MRFEDTAELRGAEFRNVDLSGARFRNVDLSGARVMEAMLVGARLSGLIDRLVVNDVEVAPLIDAELNRRYPERAKLAATDVAGVREAWTVVEGLWATTTERAASVPEATLHERVEDEWSFLETLRHLVFVTDGWISGTVLGRPRPHHPLGVAPSFITDPERLGLDVHADPALDEVLPLREARMTVVRDLVGGLTEDDLARRCGEHTLLGCLRVVFDEEWHHNWYANRDLDVLTAG